MVELCQECLHIVFEDCLCRCTEDKIIGCIYIGLAEGCTYYDTQTKKRCKKRVVETENGKLYMCIEHSSKKKIHIKTDSKKKSDESKTERKKIKETEPKKQVKRKIVKKIKEDE